MDFLDIPPEKSIFGTENLLPADGVAVQYWPYQIAQNLNFIYGEQALMHSFNTYLDTQIPDAGGSLFWHVWIPAGTYSFTWSIRHSKNEGGTISGTINGTKMFAVEQFSSGHEEYLDEETIWYVSYSGWINTEDNWYRLDYSYSTSSKWMVDLHYCGGVSVRWFEDQTPGARRV